MPTSSPEPLLQSVKLTWRQLNISPAYGYELAASRALPIYKLGGKAMHKISDVHALVNRLPVAEIKNPKAPRSAL